MGRRLQPCFACGHEMSVDANKCPACGEEKFSLLCAGCKEPLQQSKSVWGGGENKYHPECFESFIIELYTLASAKCADCHKPFPVPSPDALRNGHVPPCAHCGSTKPLGEVRNCNKCDKPLYKFQATRRIELYHHHEACLSGNFAKGGCLTSILFFLSFMVIRAVSRLW